MKKVILISLAVFIVFIFMSCGTVNVVSKYNEKSYAYLMPQFVGEVKEVRSKWNVYLFWGLLPLGDNSTDNLIMPKEMVRVRTEENIFTYIIRYVSFGIISANVAEVEVLKDDSVNIDTEKKEIN
jgi:hypothetical protein